MHGRRGDGVGKGVERWWSINMSIFNKYIFFEWRSNYQKQAKAGTVRGSRRRTVVELLFSKKNKHTNHC